jgi:DNA polymerase-3 subunit alpha
MNYRIVLRRPESDEDVEIDGTSYPLPCVVEDEHGLRILLAADRVLRDAIWHWAVEAGVAAVVAIEEHCWCARAEDFSIEAEHDERQRLYRLPDRYWFPYRLGMSAMEIEEATEGETETLCSNLGTGALTKPQFVHLHTHSEFSALDGLSKVQEAVDMAVADGNPALAFTDHGNVAVHPTQQAACDKAGIKSIFGLEAYFVHDRTNHEPDQRNAYYHLCLWAMDDVGLRNLWALSTASYGEDAFYYKPRVDWELLERYSEGIIASTACLRGPVAHEILQGNEELADQNLARLMRIFPDRFYVEIHANQLVQQITINAQLVGMAERHSLPTIAVVDSHYAEAAHKHDHQVWLSIQTNSDISDDTDLFGGNQDYHLMRRDEVIKALDYFPDELVEQMCEETVRLADRCTARIVGKGHNPIFSKASEEWPDRIAHDVERMYQACLDRWDERTVGKREPQSVYLARFQREIQLLIDKGFAGYFLMVASLVTYAKSHKVLVGPGRGSGGGSLVAYLMGITEIDPVEYDLLFERFMTDGRTALPDFDIDFPSSKKQFMLDYVSERWGSDHVATVGTQLRLKSKGIVRDVARAIKSTLPDDYWRDVDAVSALIGAAEAGTAGLGMSWEDLWDEHGEVLEPYRKKYPELFRLCGQLHGRLKTYGSHPAGVIVDPDSALTGALPLRRGENGMVTQFDMVALEELQQLKIDLLNLRTLDTLQNTLDLIHQTTGRWIDVYAWDEELRDPQVFEELSQGWTLGVFQIETQVGTQMTKRFKPRSVEELADVITLVRPGPMRSGLTETFLRRRAGEEPVSFVDPRLEQVLAKSYGTMIYQEHIMAVVMLLAGYDSNEADEVRKVLGKKKVDKVLSAGQKFVSRAVPNGMTEAAAEHLWEQMAEFAKYSFGGAHAVAYAILGVWTAWFKIHYPVQFITAALSTVKPERIPEFVEEARRMGYSVLPPDINASGRGFSASDLGVRYGLDSVKGIGDAALEAILASRNEAPYTSFEDFIERKGPKCNSGHVKTLVKIGAFDSLVPNRKGLEQRLELEAVAAKGTDTCLWKGDEKQIRWLPKLLTPAQRELVEATPELMREHTEVTDWTLPCGFPWLQEPSVIGGTGKPMKRKPPAKKCARSCRNYSPAELPDTSDIEPYTDAEIRAVEMDVLGVFLSSTPFDEVPEDVRAGLSLGVDVLTGEEGSYAVLAMVKGVRQKEIASGTMAFMTISTEQGALEVVIFPSTYEKYAGDLIEGNLLLMGINKDERGQKLIDVETLD